MATIYRLQPRHRIRNCRHCRGHFKPIAETQQYCGDCFHWNRALQHVVAAGESFDALQRQRR